MGHFKNFMKTAAICSTKAYSLRKILNQTYEMDIIMNCMEDGFTLKMNKNTFSVCIPPDNYWNRFDIAHPKDLTYIEMVHVNVDGTCNFETMEVFYDEKEFMKRMKILNFDDV